MVRLDVSCFGQGAIRSTLMLPGYRGVGPERLRIRIIVDQTAEPLAAAVMVTDEYDRGLEILAEHDHVKYLGRRQRYVEESVALGPA